MKFLLLFCLIFIIEVKTKEINLQCDASYENYHGRYIKTCVVQNLSVTSRDDILVTVNGVNLTTDYEKVLISNQNVNFVPKQFGDFFGMLKLLDIMNSKLQSIEKDDLAAFTHLTHLDLRQNELTTLDENLFESNKNLVSIDFNSNRLKNIGEDILNSLHNLQDVSFRDNACITLGTNSYSYNTMRYSIETIKKTIRETCPSIKDLKREYCSSDFQILENKITALELSLEEEKLKSKKIHEKFDGLLDTATTRLLEASKQVETCGKVEARISEEAEKTKVEIDLNVTYVSMSFSSLEVLKMRVDSPGALIKKILLPADPSYSEEINTVGQQISFSVIDQQTFYFPINLGEFLPQLKYFHVISSGLFEIEPRIFQTLPGLTELILKDNKLQEIPADTFNNLKNLIDLDLSFNNIWSLDKEVFAAQKKLENLNLGHNMFVTLESTVFGHLGALKVLNLNDNELKYISANLLSTMANIKAVNLSNNICIDLEHPKSSFAGIEKEIIDSCIAPIKLQCMIEDPTSTKDLESIGEKLNEASGSKCQAVDLVIEHPKTKILSANDSVSSDVTIFTIASQQTLYLPFELAKTFPKLEKIIVEHSKLTALMKQDFDGLKSLKHVEITFNNISAIDNGTFDDVTQLEHLNLTSNNIKSLPNKLFSQLNHLRVLILSDNLLKKFTASLLPPKNAIEEFQIRNNQLELIETKTLRFLRKAKLIDMTENICIDMKYEKSQNSSRALVELSGEIDLNCSEDETR